MKYTLITQRCGCHLLVEALLRSVEKHLEPPDEILILDGSDLMVALGIMMDRQILKVRNDYFLMLDQDIMMFDNEIVKEMYKLASEPNTYACGAIDIHYNQDGFKNILVASCNMVSKKMYMENEVKFYSSEPCLYAFGDALRKGQKLAKVGKNNDTFSISPAVFHLNQGFKTLYSDAVLSGCCKKIFEQWKRVSGSKEIFEDYVIDDGADYTDNIQINNNVVWTLEYAPEIKRPISVIRLEEEGVNFLTEYFSGKQVDKELAEELITYIKSATWLDHSYMLRGCFNAIYDPQLALKYSDLYTKLGITFIPDSDFSGRYCSPLQNYLFFISNLRNNFYSIVRGKRVMYTGPYDAIGELNKKKDLNLMKYAYCPIDKFFERFKVNDWDIVFVSGGLYANIIVGRVKKMGGVAVNIGDAVFFNPDDNIKKVVSVGEDGISYTIKDGYPNYGKRLYEKYLMEYQ